MDIILNSQPTQINAPCSVERLLEEIFAEKQSGIAVAINDSVIPRLDWSNHLLKEHDQVLVIKATQGG